MRLLERVEHRVAKSAAEREAIFRLRYQAFSRNGLIERRADEQLYDKRYDDAPESKITATFIDGELAGTTRISVGADENAALLTLGVYPEIIGPLVRAGSRIVEFTRLAANLELARAHAELPYIVMRPGYLAAEHFRADYAVATPRAEHMAFFRRVFRGVPWSEPRDYPGLTAKFACMGTDFAAAREHIEARYPFFRSSAAEREALFGPLDAITRAGTVGDRDRSEIDQHEPSGGAFR